MRPIKKVNHKPVNRTLFAQYSCAGYWKGRYNDMTPHEILTALPDKRRLVWLKEKIQTIIEQQRAKGFIHSDS